LHGKGEINLVSSVKANVPYADVPHADVRCGSAGDACPGLFYQTPAQDGFLVRIRVPGGRLNVAQAKYLAVVAQEYGQDQIWLTNRSNVQLRLAQAEMPAVVLAQLQALGLAARNAAVDHLRNIMASPTAGIDRSALMDVGPLVVAIDNYLSNHSELAPLSAKFSIGLDGGESVSVRDRRNDVWFVAESFEQLRVYFGADDTGIVVGPDDVVGIMAAIGRIYLEISPQILGDGERRKSRKPRWREIVDHVGFDEIVGLTRRGALSAPSRIFATNKWRMSAPDRCLDGELVGDRSVAGFVGDRSDGELGGDRWVAGLGADRLDAWIEGAGSAPLRGVGIGRQIQSGLSYVGIVVPLGRLPSSQLTDLAQLAKTHGNGELRLTPWQNIIIPNVQQPTKLQADLTQLGYSTNPTHPAATLVACSGSPGCASSFTFTQTDAMRIIENLQIDRPINIHVSGCNKGCAQPYASDIALMGMASGNYDLYTRSDNQIFGELVRSNIAPIDLPQVIREVVQC
jgi:ferredoxin-nitrite reductase